MKSINELLVLLKEEIVANSSFSYGMCGSITNLEDSRSITAEEVINLRNYLRKNSPTSVMDAFWWISGDKEPRLKWLDEHIKLNTDGYEKYR